jgi:hypothetical protein
MAKQKQSTKKVEYPTDAEIRAAIARRAADYSELTGTALSAIGQQAVSDPAFVTDVAEGRNITLKLYKRFMDWLDDHWPTPAQIRAQAERKSA